MATEAETSEAEPKRGGGPFKFFSEVRAEARKVTWATRQEVWVSTFMVLMMVLLATIFFFVVDLVIGLVVNTLLGIS